MKISRKQIRKIIKEYEQYVDEDGNVWDDEGNVTRKGAAFGRQYGGDTYGTNAPWQGGRSRSRYSSSRKTTHVGASANTDQIAAVETALTAKPNNFLSSILSQLKQGRGLSSKQKSIVKKILAKTSPGDAKLFESKEWYSDEHETLADKKFADSEASDWTEGDLVDAIRDYSKELTGRRNTYGHPDDLESLTWQELSDYYEEMFDSPEAREFQAQRDREDQKFADSKVGYEKEAHPLEGSPLRQGMGHRQESTLRVSKKKLRETINKGIQSLERTLNSSEK